MGSFKIEKIIGIIIYLAITGYISMSLFIYAAFSGSQDAEIKFFINFIFFVSVFILILIKFYGSNDKNELSPRSPPSSKPVISREKQMELRSEQVLKRLGHPSVSRKEEYQKPVFDDECREESCMICFQEIEGGLAVRFECCKNYAHFIHISTWLRKNSSCPVCKTRNLKYRKIIVRQKIQVLLG